MPNSVQIGKGFMPLIGLGTWTATDDVIEKAVDVALNIGYRQIGKYLHLYFQKSINFYGLVHCCRYCF